jgi:thiosulfate/3-mercaptopyruvate sulfurtransferase
MRKLDLRSGNVLTRLLGLGLALLFLLTICACDTEEVIIPVPPTATLAVMVSPPPPTATPRPTSQPLAFPLAAPERISLQRVDDHTCVDCHTNKLALQAAAEGARAGAQSTQDTGQWAADPVQAEAWERVWLDQELFFQTLHGRYGCVTCHGGTPDSSYPDVAHQGLEAEPSAAGVCVDCHVEEVAGHEASLHANLAGYRTVLAARSSPNQMVRLEEMMANHCDGCHTTACGQCHITRAQGMGGGLVNGHLFEKRPHTDQTCAGCHGSRIFTEYRGEAEGLTADVHWSQAQMQCFDCHSPQEMHGTLGEFIHRYDGPPEPSCQDLDCHPEVRDDAIEQHDGTHLEALSCQACHSTAYRNCFGCHVTQESGLPSFRIEPAEILFKIGRNPLLSPDRPWEYVPLRHVPITRDSFSYYSPGLLDHFDALPVWKYTTPHNIQRITPQNEGCNACHGNVELFLTVEDLPQDEWGANLGVVVQTVPSAVSEGP